MGFFGRLFPYSNLHDLNLDWIMQQIQDLQAGSAEALAQILAQGITGTEFHWAATLDELIVKDAQDTELYRIKWDGDGFTLTKDNGTPLTYRVSNGTLTAPTVNGTVIRGGSAAITGEVTCGTITPGNPVDVAHGGTGATTAAAARTALGAMEDATVPITKGGTGATTAAAARTALGAMAADAVIPIAQGGTGMTGSASGSLTAGVDITLSEITLWKIGNVVTCAVCVTPSAQINERATIATLPAEFRWSHDYPGFSIIIVNGATGQSIAGYTRVDGSIVTRGQLAAGTAYWISFTMII